MTYCWCVQEESGMPIPGMATHMVEPNCTIQEDDREMKGITNLQLTTRI